MLSRQDLEAIAAARADAATYYAKISRLAYPREVAPSDLWHNDIEERHRGLIAAPDDVAVLGAVQADNLFTFGRRVDDPLYRRVIDGYITYLQERSNLLVDAPLLQETRFCPSSSCSHEGAKEVSGMFLWFLSTYESISRHVTPQPDVAVEIGAGYGGLARLFKLAAPGVTYCIIDLHECLYFSLFFLKSHFPCASYCLVDGRDRLLEALERPRDFDFIFIPASLIDGFASSREALTANLVINTASFGEMTQSAVDRYVRLIQAELEVDFFYSHNRFGSLDMVPEYTTPLDPYWTTMMWKRRGRDTFTHIEPMTPPSLELIVGRRPRAAVSAAALRIEADRHFDLAMRGAPSANRLDAEYHLWESVRLSPNAANLKAWCDRLRDDCPAELAYFERARLLNR